MCCVLCDVMTGTLRADSVCVCVCVCVSALQHNQLWSRQSHERCPCAFCLLACVFLKHVHSVFVCVSWPSSNVVQAEPQALPLCGLGACVCVCVCVYVYILGACKCARSLEHRPHIYISTSLKFIVKCFVFTVHALALNWYLICFYE